MKPNSLSKQERLKSRKEINELLLKGKSTFGFPFRAVYYVYRDVEPVVADGGAKIKMEGNSSVVGKIQIMVSVPKRNFKRAVMRNLLKRRTREACRLNKRLITLQPNERINILFVYVAKTELPYATIEKAVCNVLCKIKEAVNEED